VLSIITRRAPQSEPARVPAGTQDKRIEAKKKNLTAKYAKEAQRTQSKEENCVNSSPLCVLCDKLCALCGKFFAF
jgi:hypothetical protein